MITKFVTNATNKIDLMHQAGLDRSAISNEIMKYIQMDLAYSGLSYHSMMMVAEKVGIYIENLYAEAELCIIKP